MYIISARNVNKALAHGVALLGDEGLIVKPRGKATLEFPSPVVTVYKNPTERVLFNDTRDANPFFHFFESIWMLAGRSDVKFLAQFNKRMSEFSDDGSDFWGAYGWRWRHFFGFDQLQGLLDVFRVDRDSRRGVVAMWSPSGDLVAHAGVGGPVSKDVPCNTQLYFKIRNNLLQMTICNRSNDMLWGAYGANAVHMSYVQEYIADKLGVGVGTMYQMSDSFHVYLDGPGGELWRKLVEHEKKLGKDDLYSANRVVPFPLGAEDKNWDIDLEEFFHIVDKNEGVSADAFVTPFFKTVVVPLWLGWLTRDLTIINACAAVDWRQAALEWLLRRS